MAPGTLSPAYLPELSSIFAGDCLVPTWEALLDAVTSRDETRIDLAAQILTDQRPQKILAHIVPAYGRKTPSSKTAFDTSTSLNISPSPDRLFDIAEVKDDALWLSSKLAEIDELEALRLVVLEWQYRPEARLRTGFSEAEIASLKNALGTEFVDKNFQNRESGLARDDARFDTADARRARVLGHWFRQQVAVLGVSIFLLDVDLLPAPLGSTTATLRTLVATLRPDPKPPLSEVVTQCVDAIQEHLKALQGREWGLEDPHLSDIVSEQHTTLCLRAMALVMDLLLMNIRQADRVQPEALLEWLRLMQSVEFFAACGSILPAQQDAIRTIQSNASLVTVALIDVALCMTTLEETASSCQIMGTGRPGRLFFETDSVQEVHEILWNLAPNPYAGPAVLSWAIILHRIKLLAIKAKENRENQNFPRALEGSSTYDAATGHRTSSGSVASLQQTLFEDIYERIMAITPVDSPADEMIVSVTGQGRVFDYLVEAASDVDSSNSMLAAYRLQVAQEVVAVANSALGYTPDLVSAQLAILTATPRKNSDALFDPSIAFVNNPALLQSFYQVSVARFPYETLPFLQFSKELAKSPIFNDLGVHYVEHQLRNMATFTQAAVQGVQYDTVREDENANLVSLLASVTVLGLPPDKQLAYTDWGAKRSDVIPRDTLGEVISDNSDSAPVIKWYHQYDGLFYLGQLIELHYMGILKKVVIFESAEDVVAEIIALVASLLSSILAHGSGSDQAKAQCHEILQDLGSSFNTNADVATCVFEILEQELQAFRRILVPGYNLRLLISCLDFIIVLSRLERPSLWTNLGQTSLFNNHSSHMILNIISTVEVPAQTFDFLEKYTELYERLVDLALEGANDGSFEPGRNLQRPVKPALHVSKRLQAQVLSSLTDLMFNVFQGISSWAFASDLQQIRIVGSISRSFSSILQYTLDIGETFGAGTEAAAPFSNSAQFLSDAFRPLSLDDRPASTAFRCLMSASLEERMMNRIEDEVDMGLSSIITFLTLTVRLGKRSGLTPSATDVHLFSMTPVLVRIIQGQARWHMQSRKLMQSLLEYVDSAQPSSLLGHLGSRSLIEFLNTIKHLQHSLALVGQQESVWKLLSLMVKPSQQWIAMVILTGVSPDGSRRATPDTSKVRIRGSSFMQMALEALDNIHKLSHRTVVEILRFVSQAQESWMWVTKDLSDVFFVNLIGFLTSCQLDPAEEFTLALHNSAAALVTDLATTHLHHARLARETTIAQKFIPLLAWLQTTAIAVDGYNASLHSNLRKNFAAKYPGISVADIKRTGLTEQCYGDGFYYDLQYAAKLLVRDPRWRSRTGTQSFAGEFRRANTNLSLIDSQLALLQSVQRIYTEHGAFFARDKELRRNIVQILRACLESNTRSYPPEKLFDSVFQTRVDLAVAIGRELVNAGARGYELTELLTPAWEAVRFRNGSYHQAILNEDVPYWRSLLLTLTLVTQFHLKKKQKQVKPIAETSLEIVQVDPANEVFLAIISSVVTEGFKSIVAELQEKRHISSTPSSREEEEHVGLRDLSILLTLLQSILRLPSLPQFSAELAERISSSGIINSCLLLYSWSHLLPSSQGSLPPCAELSLQLLVSISSLPLVAEELAVEGVLNRLLTSRTTESLQRMKGGISHVDSRPNGAMLHNVWALGLLPLCLNLLHAVGGAIAAEISDFLNQFPNQLLRASTAFMASPQSRAEGTDVITFNAASEASSLALISLILASYREAGASAAVDPVSVVPLAGYDEHRKAISEDIKDVVAMKGDARRKITVVTTGKEAVWQRAGVLDEIILRELEQAVRCLNEAEGDEEK